MKRKWFCIALILGVVLLAACGGSDNGESGTAATEAAQTTEGSSEAAPEPTQPESTAPGTAELPEYTAADYVSLDSYTGMEVEVSDGEVTDEEFEMLLQQLVDAFKTTEKITDRETKEGDTINFDYSGAIDGVAFDGGTAQNQTTTLGNGGFIDGFEEGLLGAKKGETRDLNLTFPEEYGNEELNGADVVFTVSVNAIKRVPKLTKEWVKNNTDSKTVEEYRESVKKELQESNQETADSSVKNMAWNQVVEGSEVKEYPDEDLKAAIQEYNDSLSSYADQMGQSVEDFLKSQNMTQEQIDEEAQQYAENKIKQGLVLQAIMYEEGFDLSDEEMKKTADQMEKDYEMTLDEMAEQFGEDAVRENVAISRVMDFIVENAEINTIANSSDGKEGILIDEEDAEDEEKTEED